MRAKGYKCSNVKCNSCIAHCMCGELGDAALDCVNRVATRHTNADRIRSMSDEQLAKEMIFFCPTDTVFKGTETYEKPHYTGLDGGYYSTSEELIAENLKWLQQPSE